MIDISLKILGVAMVALPFIVVYGLIWRNDGFVVAASIFLAVCAIAALISFGVILVMR